MALSVDIAATSAIAFVLKRMTKANQIDAGSLTDTTRIQGTIGVNNGNGGHAGVIAQLFDKDDTLIATAHGMGASGSIHLFPNATAGDNGSSANVVRWHVDIATFATGKMVFNFGGTSGPLNNGLILELFQATGGTQYFDNFISNGHADITVPFTVTA